MKGIKFVIVFTFLLSAASLAASWFLYQRLSADKSLLEKVESEKVQAEDHASSLQTEINQFQQENKRLTDQVKDYVKQRDAAKEELDQAFRQVADMKKQVKELESQKDTLTQQLSESRFKENAIVQEQEKVASVAGAVAPAAGPSAPPVVAAPIPEPSKEMVAEEKKPEPEPKKQKEKKKSKKTEKVEPQAEKKEESKIKNEPPAPPPSAVPQTEDQRPHQVLSVNRQFNFVVVNIGMKDRLKVGDSLRVEQAGKLAARLQIEKLYENFSACTIVEEIKPFKIQEGDLVRTA